MAFGNQGLNAGGLNALRRINFGIDLIERGLTLSWRHRIRKGRSVYVDNFIEPFNKKITMEEDGERGSVDWLMKVRANTGNRRKARPANFTAVKHRSHLRHALRSNACNLIAHRLFNVRRRKRCFFNLAATGFQVADVLAKTRKRINQVALTFCQDQFRRGNFGNRVPSPVNHLHEARGGENGRRSIRFET